MQVAISKTGFVRAIQSGANTFQVQSLAIRGESKLGASPFWKQVYVTDNCDRAVELMHQYAGEVA